MLKPNFKSFCAIRKKLGMSHVIFSFLCFILKLNGFLTVLFLLEDSNLIMIESCPSGGLLMPLKALIVFLQWLFFWF